MSDIYVGAYVRYFDMRHILNRRLWELNGNLSSKLRSIGYANGVAKSRKRQLLKFYLVTNDEFEQMVNPSSRSFYQLKFNVDLEPKLAIKKDELDNVLNQTNQEYEKTLGTELEKIVQRI